jgi:lipopolysaccharide biosynthesis glycosyltransferase
MSKLAELDLRGCAVGMCPEAPIDGCSDRKVSERLGARAEGCYFNAGVLLLDCDKWNAADISLECAQFISQTHPDYHDQSAMNYVLHGLIRELPPHFNCHSNVRTNWPDFRPPRNGDGLLIHLVDYPKPWSLGGRWVHMFGPMWWQLYEQTAHGRSSRCDGARFAWSRQNLRKYKKALKDRVLFALYCRGLMSPKGVGAAESRGPRAYGTKGQLERK